MNNRYNVLQKVLAGLLSLVMVFGLLPVVTGTAAAAAAPGYVSGTKKADPETIDWENYFGPNKKDTEFAGMVWSDKSVFGAATNELPGIALDSSDNFLIALSTMASNLSITGSTSTPTDTMLVLDLSGSMVDGTESVGYVRQGYNYREAQGIDTDIIEALVSSTNAVIESLMKQNVNNRVGVVLYSGNTSTNQAATADSATVVLPLGRYAGINGEYLELDAPTTTTTVYEYVRSGWGGGSWQAAGQVTYVPTNSDIDVSIKAGLKTEAGANVSAASKTVVGGTYIQNGLYKAMNEFLAVTDTTVPESKAQAGAERLPVVVLMTDGAPTIATTDYTSIGNSNTGNGGSTNDRITFLTQLTAAYVRGRVAAKYQETATDEAEVLFLTLGLGTENSQDATNTLYPAGNSETLQGYWNRYLAATSGNTVDVIAGQDTLEVTRDSAVTAMNYVDKYFYASDAQGLIDSFEDILGEIELKAASYTTLVQGGNADLSGYVTFEDELGELMEVKDMKGILLGNTLFSGKEVAKAMNEGALGTPNGDATDLGNELVATVKERIPGLTTTLAQQLINQAYLDDQLHYTDDNTWSNYIGWYSDANGNYAGFWDKDVGYEAKDGAVYANKSYGYLGVNGDSNMMHVVVLVRTNLQTLHQTVYFKVPASLLPTVTYKITLAENDPNTVDTFTQTTADPIQLVFEVGLRSDINAVNLEAKVAEHIAKGGHVHRNADGSIDLYTNSWAIGNDTNGNGVPDPDEHDSAVVADAHFHPALENSRYYFTEDALVLDANGNPVSGDTRPSGTGYHHDYHIYNETSRTTVDRALSATTLSKTQKNAEGYWYVPAGTAYRELPRMRNYKTENTTGTLDYSDYPAIFADENIDVYNYLGNNGTVTIAPASGIALRKEVSGAIDGVSAFTFEVTLSDTAAQPILTDANGDDLAGVTMSAVNNGKFTVTMPADVTAYISGINPGTTVTVTEKIEGDYKVAGIKVAGADQTGSAVFTVPAYAAGVAQMVPVTFTNAPNGYGDLVIDKDVTHNLASDPAALAGKVFTFRVKLTGDKIAAGQTYTTSKGVDVKVGADGYLLYTDGSAITLRNEESLTVYDIPEHTTYTVTEEPIPGFTLESVNGQTATQASGVISADQAELAAFVNRYPDAFTPVDVPLEIRVNKILTENSPYTGNEEFVFVMQRLLSDGTYPNVPADNGEEFLKITKNSNASAVWTLTFDSLGTHYLRVVELKPSQQTPAGTDTPGMDYSNQQALFEISVTDTDMDGVLEIAVKEEAHITVSGAYTDNDPEQITGITAETTFENIYEVGSTNATLNVHKTLNNATGAEKHLTDFRFTLYPCDDQGVVQPGVQGVTVTSSAIGEATFNIFLNTAGTFHYKVVEEIPAGATLDAQSGKYVLNGMYYDATAYLFTVTAQVNGAGDLVVTDSSLTDLATGSNVASGAAEFVNDYILSDINAHIPVRKSFSGRELKNGETFKFHLVRTNDTYTAPLTGSEAYAATKDTATTDLFSLNFDKVGSYHYTLTEEIPAGAQDNVLNGVRYDTAVYHIMVNVTDNGDGTLKAATQIHKVGQTNAVNEAVFENVYEITGQGSVTIGGKKTLDGRMLYNGEFRFGLYDNAQCAGTPIAIAVNNPDGTFSFPELVFTPAHLNADKTAKEYQYFVKEIDDGLGGITYDTQVREVTVRVSHENGNLIVTPSNGYNDLAITNYYSATGVQVIIPVAKLLSGDWTNVPAAHKEFTFELFETGEDFIISAAPIDTVTIGAGAFSFQLNYIDGQEGKHYYVLKELAGDKGGILYDAGEYHITVNVTDPGDGQMAALVTIYRPGTGNAGMAIFTNTYKAEPTQILLEGSKRFVDISTNQPKAIGDGQFQFVALEGNDVVATGSSKTDGTIAFTPIVYTEAGNHTYTVVEVSGNAGGVDYDDAVFTVTVSVVDNGEGVLTATANYGGNPIVFENTYDPGQTGISLEGEKTLTGKDMTAGEFTFEVYEGNTKVAEGTNAAATDGAAANISFEKITYTAAGVHTYKVVEKNEGKGGIGYDDAVFTVVVTVVDNGDGTLTATADYGAAPVAFANTYAVAPTDITLEGEKTLTGRDQIAGEFTFGIYEGNTLVAEGENKADGAIAFEKITYTAAGDHAYTVKEIKGSISGITYDETVFAVTVSVVDNGDGTMTATPTYSNEIVFENTYSAADAELILKAKKTLTGRELENGEFSFRILEGDKVVATGTNTADGTVTFSPITYTEEGEHTYTVKEVKGNVSYVIYDDAVYTVTVKVTDPGDGQLVAAVYAGSTQITDGVAGSFANEFAPPATPVTGDDFNMSLMVTITAISGMGIIFLAVLVIAEDKKKKALAE